MRPSIKRVSQWLEGILVVVLLLAALLGFYSLTNIHRVEPGVYRSAQLPGPLFRWVIDQTHLHSILNLRGPNSGQAWYDNEVALAKEKGLQHYDLAFSSQSMPSKQQLQQLVKVILTSPKPLLMHCQSGSDRSGMASAMVVLLKGQPIATARQQISWFYLAQTYHRVGTMVLDHYQQWLKQHHFSRSSRGHLLQWVGLNVQGARR